WDLANLLEKPGKSLDQLLKDGTVKSESSEAVVDETSSVLRGKIDYDKLGRMLSYTDTSTNADGSVNRNTVGGMNYDKLGRVLGFINISDYSKVMKSEYQLNGKNLDDAGILDVTSKTGKTLWQLIKEGSITKKESWVESNEKTESVRSGVKYNENGNMVSYTEKSSDPKSGVEQTESQTTLTYNEQEQITSSKLEAKTKRTNGSQDLSITTTVNEYDAAGRLVSATALGENESRETALTGMGKDGKADTEVSSNSTSKGKTTQIFTILNGQARLLAQTSQTTTESLNGDASSSTQNVFYDYDGKTGRTLSASGITQSNSWVAYWPKVNADGSVDDKVPSKRLESTSVARQVYSVYGNQSKVALSLNTSESKGSDGSKSVSNMAVSYTYNNMGRVEGASGSGKSISNSGFRVDGTPYDTTESDIQQIYGKIINDQAVMTSQITNAKTKNLDGSTNEQTTTQTYGYDVVGRMNETKGTGNFTSNDGHGAITQGMIDQVYEIMNGQARMVKSVTSSTQKEVATKVKSFKETKMAEKVLGEKAKPTVPEIQLPGPKQQIPSQPAPAQGMLFDETGKKFVGAGLAIEGVNYTIGMDESGKKLVVQYRDKDRNMVVGDVDLKQNGDVIGLSFVIKGVYTDTVALSLNYDQKTGQMAVSETGETWTATENEDRTVQGTQMQKMTVTYKYDRNGLLLGANGVGNSEGNDGYGNKTYSAMDQKYNVIQGQAKMTVSTTRSFSQNLDGSYTYMGLVPNSVLDSRLRVNDGEELGVRSFREWEDQLVKETEERG
ncbi:MAG: hypothetical protein HYS58_00230, partial [Elusimicrobia bacterium]|nr:hypothetical protein [Elusimicrobiota bacterium]